ncbi:MAG: PfkB family carbohydrate kinase [Alphaproteobacteria bacterium]
MKNHYPKAVFAGRAVEDNIFPLDDDPVTFDGRSGRKQEYIFAGGSCVNAAVAFGRLCRKAYRREGAFLYAPVGITSNKVNIDLSDNGVILRDCRPDNDYELPSNFSFVAKGGKRRLITDEIPRPDPHAERNLGLPKLAMERLPFDMGIADVAMIDTRCPLVTTAVARAAKDASVPVVLDAGKWRTHLPTLIALSDIVIASHEFAPNGQKATPEEILDYLVSKNIQVAAVTRGEEDTLLYSPQGIIEIPVLKVPSKDTTAAGDIMHGAFCYFYAVSKDPAWSIEQANIIGSESVRYFGPRECFENINSVPTDEDYEALKVLGTVDYSPQ